MRRVLIGALGEAPGSGEAAATGVLPGVVAGVTDLLWTRFGVGAGVVGAGARGPK